jgi:hypothetical protein
MSWRGPAHVAAANAPTGSTLPRTVRRRNATVSTSWGVGLECEHRVNSFLKRQFLGSGPGHQARGDEEVSAPGAERGPGSDDDPEHREHRDQHDSETRDRLDMRRFGIRDISLACNDLSLSGAKQTLASGLQGEFMSSRPSRSHLFPLQLYECPLPNGLHLPWLPRRPSRHCGISSCHAVPTSSPYLRSCGSPCCNQVNRIGFRGQQPSVSGV